MSRRTLYPMPIEGLIDHPQAIGLPAAAFGMLSRLCCHFWQTECRPLPKSQDELRGIVRAHRPTWGSWKADILKVFEDIRPELERHYRWRETRRSVLGRVALRGSAAAAAHRHRERIARSQPTSLGAGVVVPKKLPRGPGAQRDGSKPAGDHGVFVD